MSDHLLVRELITVSALNNTIQQKDGAKGLSFDNRDILQMSVIRARNSICVIEIICIRVLERGYRAVGI